MSKKATNDALRAQWTEKVKEWLAGLGEEVLRTGANELAFPVVDGEGEDNAVVITVKIPVGSRDGDAYDPYAMAEDYAIRQREKAEKAKKDAEAKAKKIARDERLRQQKAEARAKHEAGKDN